MFIRKFISPAGVFSPLSIELKPGIHGWIFSHVGGGGGGVGGMRLRALRQVYGRLLLLSVARWPWPPLNNSKPAV
jgi:hypothetical protein